MMESATPINCYQYRYLSINISDDGTLDKAINERNRLGREASSIMKSITLNNCKVRPAKKEFREC